jgi:hypothetical protein
MNSFKDQNKLLTIVNIINCFLFFFIFTILILNVDNFFDFTDESFYYLWGEQPENFYGTTTHFGYLANYIFKDLSYNIKFIRIFVLYTTAILLFLFCYNLKYFLKNNFSNINTYHAPFFFSIALSGFYFFNFFFIVFSYNWINYVSILLITIGLFRASNPVFIRNNIFLIKNITNLLLISFGLFFIFFSKLSTYLLMNIFLFLWFHVFIRHNRIQLFLVQFLSIFLIICFVYFNFSSFKIFIEITTKGLNFESILADNRSAAGIVKNLFSSLYNGIIFFYKNHSPSAFGLLTYFIYLLFVRKLNLKIKDSFILFILMCFSTLALTEWMYIFYLLILIIITTLFFKNNVMLSKSYFKKNILIIFFGFYLPFAFSFGTANNIIYHSFYVSIFYLLAFFLIMIFYYKNFLFVLYFLIVFISISFLYNLNKSFTRPYGLEHPIDKLVKVEILNRNQVINVNQNVATYIEETNKIFLANNWKRGNYIMDLTGLSPGTVYILEGKVLYFSWFNAYFEGAPNFLLSVLKQGNLELIKSAWLITSDNKKYDLNIYNSFEEIGINLTKNYTKIATIKYPLVPDTYFSFWKPKI